MEGPRKVERWRCWRRRRKLLIGYCRAKKEKKIFQESLDWHGVRNGGILGIYLVLG